MYFYCRDLITCRNALPVKKIFISDRKGYYLVKECVFKHAHLHTIFKSVPLSYLYGTKTTCESQCRLFHNRSNVAFILCTLSLLEMSRHTSPQSPCYSWSKHLTIHADIHWSISLVRLHGVFAVSLLFDMSNEYYSFQNFQNQRRPNWTKTKR